MLEKCCVMPLPGWHAAFLDHLFRSYFLKHFNIQRILPQLLAHLQEVFPVFGVNACMDGVGGRNNQSAANPAFQKRLGRLFPNCLQRLIHQGFHTVDISFKGDLMAVFLLQLAHAHVPTFVYGVQTVDAGADQVFHDRIQVAV